MLSLWPGMFSEGPLVPSPLSHRPPAFLWVPTTHPLRPTLSPVLLFGCWSPSLDAERQISPLRTPNSPGSEES